MLCVRAGHFTKQPTGMCKLTYYRYTVLVVIFNVQYRLYRTVGSSASYTEDGTTFNSLPPLPELIGNHYTTVLKNGDLFVAVNGSSTKCFLYKTEEKEWKICPSMLTVKFDAICGAIKREDGREQVVFAGGWGWGFGGTVGWKYHCGTPLDTVEIYSVEESRWRTGTTFKHQFCIICINMKCGHLQSIRFPSLLPLAQLYPMEEVSSWSGE
jgi:hypothetical protein